MSRKRNYAYAMKCLVHRDSDGRCGYCGKEIELERCTIDHIDPYGPDDIDNYLACCLPCNSSKRQKSLDEFRIHRAINEIHPEIKISGQVAEWLSEQEWYPHNPFDYRFYFEAD